MLLQIQDKQGLLELQTHIQENMEKEPDISPVLQHQMLVRALLQQRAGETAGAVILSNLRRARFGNTEAGIF